MERAERGVSSSALIAAPRPGFGTEGRPCQLWVNHFKIEFSRVSPGPALLRGAPRIFGRTSWHCRALCRIVAQRNRLVHH